MFKDYYKEYENIAKEYHAKKQKIIHRLVIEQDGSVLCICHLKTPIAEISKLKRKIVKWLTGIEIKQYRQKSKEKEYTENVKYEALRKFDSSMDRFFDNIFRAFDKSQKEFNHVYKDFDKE